MLRSLAPRLAGLALALALAAPTAPAARAQQAPDLAAPLPVDSAVRIGTLPNGLRYYVRANHEPRARAELRLAVNAGSVLEDDDQRGLAHFVEHMAFNGTAPLPEAGAGETTWSRWGCASGRT